MNLLIVDDEEIAIRGLRSVLSKSDLALDEVYDAMTISDAKVLLKSRDIQILLCDIELYNENGLSLIEWVNKEKLSVYPIVLTGHRVFDYAQKAVHLGVIEYLLKPIDREELISLLRRIIEEISDNVTQEVQGLVLPDNFNRDILLSADQFINAHISEDISRKEIAEHVHLNSDYLDRIFRRETGTTVHQYLHNKRMDYARKLLQQDEISVSMAAAEAGYTNLAHFSRSFKQTFGMNPSEYKKRISK